MLVEDYMTRHPITVGPDTPVSEAQAMMAENHIQHLPVVDERGRLMGILTPSRFSITPEMVASLNDFDIIHYLTDSKVGELMVKSQGLHTVSAHATLEEASNIMITYGVTGLPVIEEGALVGIITQGDLLLELRNLLGARETGWRVTIEIPDRRGEFERICRTVYDHGWGIMAMGSVRSPRAPDKWVILIKVGRCSDKETLLNLLQSIEGQDVIDIREVELA